MYKENSYDKNKKTFGFGIFDAELYPFYRVQPEQRSGLREKYKVDLSSTSDITETLQKAIDELPDGGVLFCRTEHIRWQVESFSKKI